MIIDVSSVTNRLAKVVASNRGLGWAVVAAVVVGSVSVGEAIAGNEAPSSKSPPSISGPAVEGGTLAASAGSWGGEHLVYSFAWERCSAAGTDCAPILGATAESRVPSDTYVLTQSDVGGRIEAVVTASNAAGSAVASSSQTAPVAPAGRRVAQGRLERHLVFSPAVGRSQPVYVYLPPGYDPEARHGYPVLYLLHGFPGGPGSFVGGAPAGATEDQLLARGLMRPTILVMPMGAPDPLTETSWVNGIGADAGWETFLARDVVGWVDSHFDANPTAAARGIAGLSDGGFGALNIALHHPREFALVESWSGYEYADASEQAVYGSDRRMLADNSPALELARVAPVLRRAGVYVWLTVGWQDGARFENAEFASQLARARIRHSFLLLPGSHLASVYRAELPAALEIASDHLSGSTPSPPAAPTTSPLLVPVRFSLAQQGVPNDPAVPAVTGLTSDGGGQLVFARRFDRPDSAEQDALRAYGQLEVTLDRPGSTDRLRLRLAPGAVAIRAAGPHADATLLALPVTVTSSTDPSCREGATGYVDLEHATDATVGVTNTLVIDLRARCAIQVGYDDAPWRYLPATSFDLSLQRRQSFRARRRSTSG